MTKPIKLINLFKVLICLLFFSSCKQGEDSKLSPLLGSGGGRNARNSLEIDNKLPDQGLVQVEIGETVEFFITGSTHATRTIDYTWTLNGQGLAAVNRYTFSATEALVGDHDLLVRLTDGRATLENLWQIKVNGPPVVSTDMEGVQRVSVGTDLTLTVTASDPNDDPLTYEWFVDGAPSPHISSNGDSATVTGHADLVGARNVTVRVSDGAQSVTQAFQVEVNWFPQACNQLEVGQICTYAGSASKGSGLPPDNLENPLRFRPIGFAQDNDGNLFISDNDNNVIWFWNRTGSDVSRIGQVIPAGMIQVVAGTGEDESGSAGLPALSSPLRDPRGLWYDDATDRLFIAEHVGDQVKYINSSGVVFVGMGGNNSHTDGDPAFNHRCRRPADLQVHNGSLYVTCYNDHRVKRWNLSTDLAYTFAGTGNSNHSGDNVLPTSGGTRNPYGIFVNDDGVYFTLYNSHRVRFVNTSGSAKTFWAGTGDAMTVDDGRMSVIIGDGGSGNTPVSELPLSGPIGQPVGITVRDDLIYIAGRNRSAIVLANNSGSLISVDGLDITPGYMSRLNTTGNGYNGSSGGVSATRFNSPYKIGFSVADPEELIVADSSNDRIRTINIDTVSVTDLLGSGNGKNGNMGDFLMSTTSHLFNFPTGLAFDNERQILFFADQSNHRIRQVDRFGLLRSAVGSGTSGDPDSENEFPLSTLIRSNYNNTNAMITSVDLAPDGSLLQINSYGHNLRVWNRSSMAKSYFGQFIFNERIATVAGNITLGEGSGPDGPALNTQLRHPNAARFYDNEGQLEMFVVDTINHCIRHIDSAGNSSVVLGLCGTDGYPGLNVPEASALFDSPRDIAIDDRGNLFISDQNNHRIWYWNRSTENVSIGSITIAPSHIAVVSCMSGTSGSASENILVSSSRCNHPVGLALRNNQLCYSQWGRHNVRCFDVESGVVRTVAGSLEATPSGGSPFDLSQEGVPATEVRLLRPTGIAFDDQGYLYISDTFNHIVRKMRLFSD